MSTSKVIGQNLREFRNSIGFSQDHVASFVNVDRSVISLYENGAKEIPLTHLEKFCDLFGIDLGALLEKNSELHRANFAFAFRQAGVEAADLQSIASFQKIVKGYLRMTKLLNEKE